MARRNIPELTQARLKELLDYDLETGVFRWKSGRHKVKAGSVATHKTVDGRLAISLDCRQYRAHDVAWLVCHGEWPLFYVDHCNGDFADNRIDNLRRKHKPKPKELTAELVRSLFDYDKETGLLTAKVARYKRKVGDVVGWHNSYGHGRVSVGGKAREVHRVIWLFVYGELPKGDIDHINGDPGDNRLENLRDVPRGINLKNAKLRKDNKSGHPGVEWNKKNRKWRARIKVNGKNIEVGSFKILEDAITARKAAEKAYGYHENHGRRV